ncbi:MAG TPA: cation:proton antiporter [Patescibacteria group bacterium]|nr:cation:proton antiporter [Patescibacteria group bacterium]
MQGLDILRDLVVIFGVSVLVVLLLHRLRLPTITGFLLSGMLLGPHGLSLVSDLERIKMLADVGVMLLLFTVGLEFSLALLRRLWGAALAGALLPVIATSALCAAASGFMGLTLGQGIFLGFLLSLSSTVIPLRALADRGQVDSPHGRAAVGVAVFQDLLVIPMMLLAPYLGAGAVSRTAASGPGGLVQPAIALIQAIAVVGGVLIVALWLVPRFLARLAALKSREVFIISIMCICLGAAWITSMMGLSLALGAFVAGLVISESEFGHQALADMLPFRDSLNSLFFVSIGMLLDPAFVVSAPVAVLTAAAAIIILKFGLIGGALLVTGQRPTVALQAGLALSQVGEFSFVLMRFATGYGLMSDRVSQVFLTSAVLTMIVTPLLLAGAPWLLQLVQRAEERGWWRPARDLRPPEEPADKISGHVIIVGYGFNGRNLARVLKEIDIPYIALEMNPETVRHARDVEGENILYGDAASPGILERLGARRARVVVLAISDPVSTRRAVAVARGNFPTLYVVARTRYLTEVDELYRLGADVVIPEEVETSMEIFSRVLEVFGVPREALVKHARRIRAERYGVFIAGRPATAPPGESGHLAGLKPFIAPVEVQVCSITEGAAGIGRSLQELDLRGRSGATVLAMVREGRIAVGPAPGMRLGPGDAVVVAGTSDQIGSAVEALIGSAA